MFTGIIETTGDIVAIEDCKGDQRFRIRITDRMHESIGIGDSIAVNGVCLTVVHRDADCIDVDISNETLGCTALGDYMIGDPVNIERALSLSDRLDGHLVSGHVDSTAKVTRVDEDGRSRKIRFENDPSIMRYIAVKGSVCVDGTSLTVNSVKENCFSVNIIPHTLQKTIISEYAAGTRVNIEVDIVARYLERLLTENN
ncbi:MAG: riboflavin synthase [Thiotrichales bacterium]|nr:riboflavin synthase [Thiotrichales bacterium]